MEFLLDPNVAYLVLLAGALLAMLAIIIPGTGLPELSAIVFIAMAAYAVYNLTFNWWALLILVVSIAPFMYSVRKPRQELFLGLSILLMVFGSVFLFTDAKGWPAVNPILAVMASACFAGFMWIAARKSMQAMQMRPRHELEDLVGQNGVTKTRVEGEGSVQVAGELWSARSERIIEAGIPIRVVRRDGFVLVVEKK